MECATFNCVLRLIILQGVPDLKKTCGFEELPGPAAKLLASNPGVRLTLFPHQEQLLELKEIACMSLRDIAKIYTVSLQITGPCKTSGIISTNLTAAVVAAGVADPVACRLEL